MKLYYIEDTIKEAGELKGDTFYHTENYIEMPLEVFERLLRTECQYVVTTFRGRLYGKAGQPTVKSTLVQWQAYGKNRQRGKTVFRKLL